jgi:hypothetical protein
MQYGGLCAVGDTVYLLTAAGDMGPSSQLLDFRKSTNNGVTWSSPFRITRPGEEIRRANIVAVSNTVHVFGGQSGAGGYGTGIYYFRSTNDGANWEPGVKLYAEADASARMAVDGATVHVAFGAKLSTNSFGGRTYYMRSTNNGATWNPPVFIGENSAESDVQARQQIAAADGRVFVMWQRERPFTGGPLPTIRLGYNRSTNGGATWEGLKIVPGDKILVTDTNVIRDHHQIWMIRGGGLHVAWTHGPPGDPSSPIGYVFSPDYGASWSEPEIAISSAGGGVPNGIVADENWAHLMVEPGIYVRRRVSPIFTSIRREGETVVLEWIGQGTLQRSQAMSGPWEDLNGRDYAAHGDERCCETLLPNHCAGSAAQEVATPWFAFESSPFFSVLRAATEFLRVGSGISMNCSEKKAVSSRVPEAINYENTSTIICAHRAVAQFLDRGPLLHIGQRTRAGG